jgi:hypothetical protein
VRRGVKALLLLVAAIAVADNLGIDVTGVVPTRS